MESPNEFSGTYNVVELQKFGGQLQMSTRQFRELKSGELLVQIHCATIHPADLANLRGQYSSDPPKVLPIVPGFEGSGKIVKVGEGVDQKLVGKRCCTIGKVREDKSYEGLWAQYLYTTIDTMIIFNKEIDYEILCFAFINPMTAVGFLDTLQKKNQKSVGQDGSSSAFGKMFIRLCAREGVKSINVVRKEQHIEPLTKLGADHVISSSDPNWTKELEKLALEYNTTSFFECVGGDTIGSVLKSLPPKSTLYHFGNLEMKRLGNLDTSDFIFKEKILIGWWLSAWFRSLKHEEIFKWFTYVKNEFEAGSDLFVTKVSQKFRLDEFEKAFEVYLTNMSDGKIIFKPFE